MDPPQSSKNELRPLMEDADPNGDVILLVGTEDPQSIRASSKILSLASPVFAAMLGPNFLEGSKLSTVQPYQLHLPEDDAEAIVWLCLVLHYRRDIDDRISFSLLEKLAFICDKYDCARALSSWSKEWLHTANLLLRFPPGQPNSEKLLYISYLFGAHESFWISTKDFLTDGLPSKSGAADRPDSLTLGLALLPESLLDSLNHDREEIILRLHQIVENLIQPYLASDAESGCKYNFAANMQPSLKSTTTSNMFPAPNQNSPFTSLLPGTKESTFCLRSRRVIHFFRELLRIGLWPITGSMRETSINSMLAKLRRYENLQGDFSPFGGNSSCKCVPTNFKQKLEEAATEVLNTSKGLCLTCVQHGKLSARDGNCQAMFRSRCSRQKRFTTISGTSSESRTQSTFGAKSVLGDRSRSTAPDVSATASVSTIPRASTTRGASTARGASTTRSLPTAPDLSTTTGASTTPSASLTQTIFGTQNFPTMPSLFGAENVSGTESFFGFSNPSK